MGSILTFTERPFGYQGEDDRRTKRATVLPIAAQVIGIARIIWTIRNSTMLELRPPIVAQLIVRGLLEFLMLGLFLAVVDSLMGDNRVNGDLPDEESYPPVPMAPVD